MKTLLLNILGTSPMVATEMYNYLQDCDIKDVILICTDNKYVMQGAIVVKASLEFHFNVHVHILRLEMEDINDNKDINSFLDQLSSTVKMEKNKFKTEKIIANVSGGRKIQTIVLSMYASIFDIDAVYNIINKDIQNYNQEYEKIKDKILEFNTDNADILYNKYKDILDPILYPSMEKLNFLKVPVINMSRTEINDLKTVLNSSFIEDLPFGDDLLKSYYKSGFITYDKTRIYRTALGEIVLNYLQ